MKKKYPKSIFKKISFNNFLLQVTNSPICTNASAAMQKSAQTPPSF